MFLWQSERGEIFSGFCAVSPHTLAVFGILCLLLPIGPVQIKRTGYKYVCSLTGSRAALPAAFMFGLELLVFLSYRNRCFLPAYALSKGSAQ